MSERFDRVTIELTVRAAGPKAGLTQTDIQRLCERVAAKALGKSKCRQVLARCGNLGVALVQGEHWS